MQKTSSELPLSACGFLSLRKPLGRHGVASLHAHLGCGPVRGYAQICLSQCGQESLHSDFPANLELQFGGDCFSPRI